MTSTTMPVLRIGDLTISPPIIQGAMGVRVSRSGLAAAVANEGCVGTIASVGLGDYEHASDANLNTVSNEALRAEIRQARALAPTGIIGVNVMVVLDNFPGLIGVCVEEEVDMIVCGSGLPLDLPKYLNGKDIKLVPIVSSARALNIICRKWKQHYGRLPDAVIVEGPEAGGHLGYSFDELLDHTAPTLEQLVTELVAFTRTLDRPIPVIAAGGIFDGADIARFLRLGAAGVQMATRFVCTDECDVHPSFKQAYLDAGKEDTIIINSPVGLPGRVIKSAFVDRVHAGGEVPFICRHHCLRTCDPNTVPYCIAKVLGDASRGDLNNAFVFAGSNAYRCTEIVPVKKLIAQLSAELLAELSGPDHA
ncbi:MAG TPA: nitronate monooxygenase family protein [bacterium]|nr:nitronate monooxygenase family protein [bacterium]